MRGRLRGWRLVVVLLVAGLMAALVGAQWLLRKAPVRARLLTMTGWPTLPFDADARLSAALDGRDLQRTAHPVQLVKVVEGLSFPTDIQFAPGQPSLMVVTGKNGRCDWIDLERRARGVLFEIDVPTDTELGLLGLAFHPRFADNGLFYVNHSTRRGKGFGTRIGEWKVTRNADGSLQRAAEVRALLELDQPHDNHNGGQLVFGADGMLYIGLGDGGGQRDPYGHGQKLDTWLGKILRIDVDRRDGDKAYAVPSDNPFVSREGALPEIWVYGVRNPWRFTFVDANRLLIADVGQDLWEELSIATRGDNLGWSQREANTCFKQPADGAPCESETMREPFYVYGRDDGQSITGGFVYEGSGVPILKGKYVFADAFRGKLWAVSVPKGAAERVSPEAALALGRFPIMASTFGRDARGELYVADLGRGSVYRLTSIGAGAP